MVVRHITSENLSTFIALYVTFTFFISTAPSFHILSNNFLETELEALNDKEIVPLLLRITVSTLTGSIFTPAAWDATGTQMLYLKTDRGMQLIP
jgi:hypothetical protein